MYHIWYKQGPGGLGIKGQFHDYYYYLFFYLSTPPAQFIHRRKWFGLRLTFHKYILFQSSNISTNPFTPMCRFSDTFFECLCTQATLLIIIRFHSYLRSREVYCISFLGGKKELAFLWYSSFYTCFCTIVELCAKKQPKSGVHCWKTEILLKISFLWCYVLQNWNTFKFQRMCTFSTVKIKIKI